MHSLTAVDLFSGAGGATQGLSDAGLKVVGAVENDPVAAATFRANHPGVVLREDDIRSVDEAKFRRELGLRRGSLTVLKACPPCQGFSSLAKGQVDSARNDLVLDVGRFVREFLPAAVLLENVPGLARDDRLSTLIAEIESAGYVARQYIAQATEFGVPQRRRRLIVMAIRRGADGDFPEDLRSLLADSFDVSPMTAGEALDRLSEQSLDGDPLSAARVHSEAVRRRIAAIPENGTRFDLPPELELACHSRLDELGVRNATSAYGRIRRDEPAPTMTTRCTTPSCGSFVHPSEHRGLTLREAATLQTFPFGYTFEGSHGQVERQIGNAVPVKLAHALGLAILALVDLASAPRKNRVATYPA